MRETALEERLLCVALPYGLPASSDMCVCVSAGCHHSRVAHETHSKMEDLRIGEMLDKAIGHSLKPWRADRGDQLPT